MWYDSDGESVISGDFSVPVVIIISTESAPVIVEMKGLYDKTDLVTNPQTGAKSQISNPRVTLFVKYLEMIYGEFSDDAEDGWIIRLPDDEPGIDFNIRSVDTDGKGVKVFYLVKKNEPGN